VRELAEWLQATPVSVTIQSVRWIIPLLQSIHILTIGVVFVSSLMIALRVLGRMRADEPFAVVWQRFAPWMWGGLVVMAVTGLTLVIGEPVRFITFRTVGARDQAAPAPLAAVGRSGLDSDLGDRDLSRPLDWIHQGLQLRGPRERETQLRVLGETVAAIRSPKSQGSLISQRMPLLSGHAPAANLAICSTFCTCFIAPSTCQGGDRREL
jgi:hypothetical protein